MAETHELRDLISFRQFIVVTRGAGGVKVSVVPGYWWQIPKEQECRCDWAECGR